MPSLSSSQNQCSCWQAPPLCSATWPICHSGVIKHLLCQRAVDLGPQQRVQQQKQPSTCHHRKATGWPSILGLQGPQHGRHMVPDTSVLCTSPTGKIRSCWPAVGTPPTPVDVAKPRCQSEVSPLLSTLHSPLYELYTASRAFWLSRHVKEQTSSPKAAF